ncbi:M3 family metallopeptidase [Leptolyngbya sp. FACHB-711]|uniref:M3 family oligoendopeptidase n=1 Tax=unclassified Leptolyngbya TaxID=2650499 RepID=UPI0016854FD0|nr:M3 family metallopeptidase [Leptolyngbya sp. FACHB-711]MBD1850096.1 oligoendopeptidase F [Cyanobacteria bacterium FACHB-502]MBD2027741.1 oligoendopeptidase F [Leptolyngbya sp. FACHB-711]
MSPDSSISASAPKTDVAQLHEPQEWDLRDLYQGFDDPKLTQDLESLRQTAQTFRSGYREQVAQLSPAEVADALKQLESIAAQSGYLYSFPSLVFSADTRNTEAKQFLDKAMEALTEIENQLLFFDLELQGIDEAKFSELRAAPELQNYQHYLDRIAQFRPHTLPEAVEQTRNQDSLTGRQAFIQLRSIHLGEQEYELVTTPDGKTASTEAELGSLLFHPDCNVRDEAYRSVRKVMQQHNSLYGYILNTVAQDHRMESQMRGYSSTLHKQLLADEVSEPVFRAIMEGTHDRFELFQRYYKLKAQSLGQPIRICDIYAPWTSDPGSVAPIPYQNGVETLLAALEQFDVNYARRAEEFFVKNWVDAKVRPGKRGGAFCAYSYGKHSYLLLSYTEDYSSLFTLAHEMGHGLHFAWIDDRQSYFNSNPPMVLAEIASTFNELLLLDYLLKQAADDKTLTKTLITRQLEDQLNLLFRQSTISRLELAIHDRAAQGSFDHKFVNEQWMNLYQELCGDAVELLPEHQYDWARIGHIYFKPFYCYQYTASNIVSLACYQKYREVGKDFIPGYLELLASGSSLDQVTALRQYVDVDIEDPTTIKNALNYVEGLLDQLQAAL